MAKNVKRATIRWVDGHEFEAVTGSEHRVVMDSSASDGGKNHGSSPMELLLVGMAGCTGMDMVDILAKKRQQVSGLEIRIEGARAETFPMIYTEIDVVYIVRGKDISPKAVQDAINLSETKYCSAGVMMSKSAKINSRYEIIPE